MCCRVFRHPCVLRVSEGRGVRVCTERWRRANLWVQPTHKQSHVSPAACRVAQHRFLVRTHTLVVRTPPDVMATRISADRRKGGVEPPPVGADAAVRWKKLRGGGAKITASIVTRMLPVSTSRPFLCDPADCVEGSDGKEH